MQQKCSIVTQEVKKCKACLNFDGSKMQKEKHFEQPYASVTSWSPIQLALAIATTNNWKSAQVDHVLAFPQAPSE